jgi:hypothetical protein
MQRSLVLLGVFASVLSLSACDDGVRPPTSPGPGSAPNPAATYTLSGSVVEMTATGVVPVEGVTVQEGRSGQQVTTGADGLYQLSGVRGPSASVTASKLGYATMIRTLNLVADTRYDFQVTRIVSYILSGTVFEMTEQGRRPIAGVSVYCDSCGDPLGHTFAETRADGAYSFSWTFNGPTALIVHKDGFRLAGNVPDGPVEGWIVATVNGDTRFDIEIARR